ncbi:MAG: hypothetical protein WC508_01290 [Patescibacteria group bacterium]
MFDQNPNSNNQIPQNLPTGSPTPAPTSVGPSPVSSNEPEDILAEVDQGQSLVKGPAQIVPDWNKMVDNAKAAVTDAKEPMAKQYKKILVIIAILLVAIVVLAASGWYAYSLFTSDRNSELPLANTNTVPLNSNQPINNAINNEPDIVNQGNISNTNIDSNINSETNQNLDSDQDGLIDTEERMYGTDPNNPDTDGDGLTDRDEVKVFRTDPNNPDTDGDGYKDGDEVKNGYDPKGAGKLLNIEQNP